MKQYPIPFLFIFFISCSDKGIVDVLVEQNESISTKLDIAGHWKFVTAKEVEDTPFLINYPNPHTPAREVGPPYPPYIGPDLIFENDTMYEVYHQTHLGRRVNYSVDSGYFYNHFKWHTDSCPVQLLNDTLFIYKPFYEKKYVREGYVKTDLNDSVFSILKKYGVNYPELAGTFFLVRERIYSGEDGSEWEYMLDFPHIIPDSIEISREQFISGLKQNMVYLMSTDEKKREYFFKIHWNTLSLTPGGWYKGEDPEIHFERRETEH